MQALFQGKWGRWEKGKCSLSCDVCVCVYMCICVTELKPIFLLTIFRVLCENGGRESLSGGGGALNTHHFSCLRERD